MSREELLNDFISYHFMEGNINDRQRFSMQESAKDYLFQIEAIEKAKPPKDETICGEKWLNGEYDNEQPKP